MLISHNENVYKYVLVHVGVKRDVLVEHEYVLQTTEKEKNRKLNCRNLFVFCVYLYLY